MQKIYDITIYYKDGSRSGFLADSYMLDTEMGNITVEKGPNSYANDMQIRAQINDIKSIRVNEEEIYREELQNDTISS